jgi:cation:H+ antiporter
MWSEAFDRLGQAHLLVDVGVPELAGRDAVVWFGILAAVGLLLAVAVAQPLIRRLERLDRQGMVRVLLLLDAGMIAGTLAFALAGVHPISLVLLIAYGFGLYLAAGMKDSPMWVPFRTADTRRDVQEARSMRGPATAGLFLRFLALALTVGFAGWVIAETGVVIAARTGLSQTVVGALMTATATSLPELVTTVAAVRRGALQLAVGGIIGGNTFDVLFLVLSDVAYRPGSVYHAADARYLFWVALALLMTGVLLLGLLKRERHGFANIGFESALLVAIYACGVAAGALYL